MCVTRMIRSAPSDADRAFLDEADLILLAGGDIARGWAVFQETGMHTRPSLRATAWGAVLMGISAGAVQLGQRGFSEGGAAPFDTFQLVPMVVDVHDEPEWSRLNAVVKGLPEHTRGLGIPLGGAIIHADFLSVEPVRKQLLEPTPLQGERPHGAAPPGSGASEPGKSARKSSRQGPERACSQSSPSLGCGMGCSFEISNCNASKWLVRKPRPKAKVRLFCFPYAGGGASAFRTWPDALPHIDIVAGAAPRPGSTPARGRPSPGWSPSSTRSSPRCVPAPTCPSPSTATASAPTWATRSPTASAPRVAPRRCTSSIGGSASPQVNVIDHPIAELPDAEFREGIASYNGTPAEVLEHKELWELLLPALRADFRVYENYAYTQGAPLDVAFSAFGGLLDEETTREELEA